MTELAYPARGTCAVCGAENILVDSPDCGRCETCVNKAERLAVALTIADFDIQHARRCGASQGVMFQVTRMAFSGDEGSLPHLGVKRVNGRAGGEWVLEQPSVFLQPTGQPANRIRLLRRMAGLTLRDLSEEISVDEEDLAGWESGEVPIPPDELEALAAFFEVTAGFVAGNVEKRPSAEWHAPEGSTR